MKTRIYKPERLIYEIHDNVYAFDIWKDGDDYRVHAIRIDANDNHKQFESGKDREAVIQKAILQIDASLR
ncbi:hypothetical protein [Halobacillus sp. KGW1]|uniref:hypothetical protein n=1 Tax=Halobacillus sp. KGW1 TaxID=1793726 RepID=UPI000781FF2F|nr:hypothetical protein [Halobacillus sp. KGW1]